MDKLEKDTAEPPSCSHSDTSLVLIGKNSRGQWVAQQQNGLFGGLFIDCKKAVRFALGENGHKPQLVIIVPDVVELDMNRKPTFALKSAPDAETRLARVA